MWMPCVVGWQCWTRPVRSTWRSPSSSTRQRQQRKQQRQWRRLVHRNARALARRKLARARAPHCRLSVHRALHRSHRRRSHRGSSSPSGGWMATNSALNAALAVCIYLMTSSLLEITLVCYRSSQLISSVDNGFSFLSELMEYLYRSRLDIDKFGGSYLSGLLWSPSRNGSPCLANSVPRYRWSQTFTIACMQSMFSLPWLL